MKKKEVKKEEKIKGIRKLKVGDEILLKGPYHTEVSKVSEIKDNVATLENKINLVATYSKKDKYLTPLNISSYSQTDFMILKHNERAEYLLLQYRAKLFINKLIQEYQSKLGVIQNTPFSLESLEELKSFLNREG